MGTVAHETAGRLYRQALSTHWLAYSVGFATVFITNASEVMVPKFIQWTLDLLASSGVAGVPAIFTGATKLETLHILVVSFGISLLIAWAGRVGWRLILARRTHVAGRDLKVGIWNVLRHQPLHIFQKYPLGDLMNRATGDWNSSRFIHGFTLVLTADMVFIFVLCLISMFMIDVPLTLLCLAIFPFLPRFIVKLAVKEHDQHVWAQEKLSDLADLISQTLGTVRMQRATKTEGIWQAKLAAESMDYAKRRYEVVKTSWKIFPLGALPTLFAYGVLVVVGLDRIVDGELTIGEFVALQSYVLMLQTPLFELGTAIAEWQKGFASLGRIAEIFNLKSFANESLVKEGSPTWLRQNAAIEVKNLTFRFGTESRVILDRVDFRVDVGESIGIFGPIGAGKSTLLNIIAGLDGPERGTTRIMGADVVDMSRKWMTENVAVVPQRSFLFAGSVRHNLLLNETYDDATLWKVLELVRLADDVRAFAQGLETWIGEWGINLSGGQKQRLALARALLRPRRILLLDDCLSAVDAVTEESILLGMRRDLADLTVVWVAHRRSTLKLCDRIYSMDQGVLIEVADDRI